VTSVLDFVVVGRVNKGKSSIVATLAEEETVPISDEPGTTTESRAYSVEVDGQVLFTLVDTPGFQDAPAALEQIRKLRTDASVSDAAVRSFVDTYRTTREFAEETRLLKPILKGGRILYVVDGTVPYSSDYEAEMEILRWTGQPRMALVNRIGTGNHLEEWKKALGQYFSIVREFDANRAGFDDRIRLLESFRELDDGARASLDRAVATLRVEQQRRRREAARLISSLLIAALTQRVELQLKPGEHEKDRHAEALEKLQNQLRDAERKAHGQIFELYRFRRVKSAELNFTELKEDLFAEKTWKELGLTHGQLFVAGTLGGAAVGLMIDLAAGGHTFLLPSVIGGVVGGTTALVRSGKKLGSGWKIVEHLMGGARVVRYGPLGKDNLPWILLDRALIYYRAISTRAHSVQGDLKVSDADSIVRNLPGDARGTANKLFAKIAKESTPSDDLGAELRQWIESRLEGLERSV
jgi:small GTP-binding protein